MTTLNQLLAQRIADLERQGAGTLAPPVAVLWTDRQREWAAQVEVLRQNATVLTLGAYDPAARTGPAIWLRCMVARTVETDRILAGVAPIVYLPGVGREDLRAVEDCPEELKPIAELQYRGVFFSHPNGRDWTVPGWLGHKTRGADVSVAGDQATLSALATAQAVLFEQDVETLRGRTLRASDLLEIVNPDVISSLLRWLDDADAFRGTRSADEWMAFVTQVRDRFKFDVDAEGALGAAERLAERDGEWALAWSRFAEAPHKYPELPSVLERVTPSTLLPAHRDSYPQFNAEDELELRSRLNELDSLAAPQARERVLTLESAHAARRASVWHELGQTPLADSLEFLADMARLTERGLGGSSASAVAAAYSAEGWRVDDAYVRALAAVESADDTKVIQAAGRAIYAPWVDTGARVLQESAHVGWDPISAIEQKPGTAVLFCDGLRFDLGVRLAAVLEGHAVTVGLAHELAALPTLTATAKPAVTPVAPLLAGGDEFTPSVAESGKAATAPVLRALMEQGGWQSLSSDELGDVSGLAWTEIGDIDALGHKVESKMVAHVDQEIRLVAGRVRDLLAAGWSRVVVVTDHGWLLMPDKLPKVDLPKHLAEPRKGRCARLKTDSAVGDAVVVPWTWDPDVRIAVAPGIATYVDGKTYDHGGISPQECVIPRLVCSIASSAAGERADILGFKWVNLRLRVSLGGAHAGCSVDLRRRATDAESSYVGGARVVDDEGVGALLVHDADMIGEAATLVVLDSSGVAVVQKPTIIGGEE